MGRVNAVELTNASAAVADALENRIGRTPLLALPRFGIYAKDESRNPGGSVKDRPALRMLLEGERSGHLRPGKTILDATSGNTGIAYAMLGAARGYPVKLCLPANASAERKRILRAYGAEIVLTDPAEGSEGAIKACRAIHASDPARYFYPDQYNNAANWLAHFHTTAPEILEQTGGRVTHFVAGMGTCGTLTGVARRFAEDAPHVRCYAVQPAAAFHGLEGMRHMESATIRGFYDASLPSEVLTVETEDAQKMARDLARTHGLLVGISSAANILAAWRLALRTGPGAVVVTLICDGGEKYLGESFWNDPD